jgi:hypothetical protein
MPIFTGLVVTKRPSSFHAIALFIAVVIALAAIAKALCPPP